MKQKRFILAAATALATMTLASIAPATVSASIPRAQSVTISVIGTPDQLAPAVKIYEQMYPTVKVNVIATNWGAGGQDTREKELILMSSGQSPDVLKMVWGKAFYRQGVIMDLTKEISSWPVYSRLTAGQKARMTYNGHIFGMTEGNNTIFLYYNKDILARIHAQPPKTLADVENIGKAIKAANLKTAKGQPIFATSFEGGNWFTDYWLWALGGQQMSSDYKHALIDSPASIKAYTWMQSLIKNGEVPKVDGTGSTDWLNGQIALFPDGQWDFNSTRNAKLNFGVSVMPAGRNALNTVSIGGVEWGIPVNSKHKTEALNFIKVLVSRDNELITTASGVGVPTDPGFYSDPQFLANWQKTGIQDVMAVQHAQLQHTAYNFLEAPFVFPDGATIYSNALGQILTQLADPASTMKSAAKQIDQGIATAD